MINNKWQHLKDFKAEINRRCKEAENENRIRHIREQVCEYLLQRCEDINDYESELNALGEIPEDPDTPEGIEELKQALRCSINIMLIYTEDRTIQKHLAQMYTTLS